MVKKLLIFFLNIVVVAAILFTIQLSAPKAQALSCPGLGQNGVCIGNTFCQTNHTFSYECLGWQPPLSSSNIPQTIPTNYIIIESTTPCTTGELYCYKDPNGNYYFRASAPTGISAPGSNTGGIVSGGGVGGGKIITGTAYLSPNGSSCHSNSDCQSQFCTNYVEQTTAPEGGYSTTIMTGTCQPAPTSAVVSTPVPTPPPAVRPSISTPTASTVTATGATLGGTVTSDGGSAITERGVCYFTGTFTSPGGFKSSNLSTNYLKSGAMSSDGKYQTIVGAQNVYVSTDNGATYTSTGAGGSQIIMDSTGKYQTIIYGIGADHSSDYGATWTSSGLSTNYLNGGAMSSDGKYQTIIGADGKVYTSSTFGTGFVSHAVSGSGVGIMMNSTGTYQTAFNTGDAYHSSDNGATWTSSGINSNYLKAGAMSSDGKYQTIIGADGKVYTSSTFGTGFVSHAVSGSGVGIMMNSTGTYQTAFNTGSAYHSSDNGATWTSSGLNTSYLIAGAMSSDGKYQTIIGSNGNTYVSSNYGASFTASSVSGSGNGVMMDATGQYQTIFTSISAAHSSDYGGAPTCTTTTGTTGSFAIPVTGLTNGSTYYFLAYAKNAVGKSYTTTSSFDVGTSTTVPTSTPTPAPRTCDANGDGLTNDADLPIIQQEWYGTNTSKSGDCNHDGVVDGLDFQRWKDVWILKQQ